MTDSDAPLKASIAVWPANAALEATAKRYADNLQLPLASPAQSFAELKAGSIQFVLIVNPHVFCDYQLELHDLFQKTKLLIDYTGGEIAYRAQHGGGRRQALAKAIGLKSGYTPNVIDATAGLGRDAFVLANLGCYVRMIERSPIMASLLEDALRRAANDEQLKSWLKLRLQLITGDAREQIPLLCDTSSADAIYIDPMYPPRAKSALVKKEMRFIQVLVGKDLDSSSLLTIALQYAEKRVVIKRPSYAAPVDGPKPTHTIESKNTRYDVYIVH